MVVGAVLVENVFALGGIGALLIEGIQASDYPVVQAIILLLVLLFLLLNLAVDMIYAVIDPRVRAAAGGEDNLKNSIEQETKFPEGKKR
jgi:peptide/nickel transport system permease protein